MTYTVRIVDAQLREMLAFAGFVVIEGPKAVGKTETAKQLAKTVIRLDTDPQARELADVSPNLLLIGEPPILIDEWQLAPHLWNWVKVAVDTRQRTGEFILTGSSIPKDDGIRDSGAGRVARLKMRPMTLLETNHSSGAVSLQSLFEGQQPLSVDPGLKIQDIVNRICVGGWPNQQVMDVNTARKSMKSYLDEIANIDLQRVSGKNYNKNKVQRVLHSLARNVGTKASNSVIARDAAEDGTPLDRKIVAGYLDSLDRVMVTENNLPWTPRLRSRDRVSASSTRYFVDPAIAAAALSVSPSKLLGGEIQFLGFLFENLAIRDLRVYMQAFSGNVMQYRDETGIEVDAILENADNQWAAIEIKLGQSHIEQAASNLQKFKNKLDISACGEPQFMAVLTATGPNYVRRDGIYVLSIGSLAP